MQLTTPHHVPPWTPRPYQIAGIDRVLDALRRQLLASQPGRVMLAAPTGAGKTGMAVEIARLIARNGGKALYIVPRPDLLPDTHAAIRQVTKAVLLVTSPFSVFPTQMPDVTLLTASTVLRRLRRWPTEASPDVIIIDEAHVDPLQARTLADAFPGAILIGLSATPERPADDALLRLYREVVQVSSPADLANDGWLVPCNVFASECPDVDLLPSAEGEFDPLAQEHAFTNPRIMGAVAEAMRTLAVDRQVLLLAATSQHSRDLAKMLQAQGIHAAAIDERTPDRERQTILAKLSAGTLRAVCMFGVLLEGLKIPDVNAIFVVHATQSRRRWLQAIGIGRLPTRHRADLLVVDFGDNWRRLGHPEANVAWTLRAQPTDLQLQTFIACTDCGRVMTEQVDRCRRCQRLVQQQPGDQPLERPRVLLEIAHEMHRREQLCAQSRQVPFRLCPWQFRMVAHVWFEHEERRVRKGLALPMVDAPIGYVEHACEQAMRRLGYDTTTYHP